MATAKLNVQLDMQTHKIVNVVDPASDQDAATKKYVDDHSGAPSGSAGGDLAGTYPNPTVAKIHETSGPTALTIGTITDGEYLKRSGSTLVSGAGGTTDIAATVHAATSKATPVDNDELALVDSAASNVLKKLLWSNLKATLKTYFDTLYASSSGSAPIGTPELIYKYTVTGSDKTSIDTGADTADAGSNVWTGGDLLEVWVYGRTDETAIASELDIFFNNDTTGTHYDITYVRNTSATAVGAVSVSGTAARPQVAGASCQANEFADLRFSVPNYLGTVGYKTSEFTCAFNDSTAANSQNSSGSFSWHDTSAVSRLTIQPHTSGKKLKVGTQILIYKRRAS